MGPDAFRFFPEVKFNFLHPHNGYVQFLLDWGVVGTLLFMAIYLGFMYRGMAGVIWEKNQKLKGIKVSCFALIAAFLFYALVDGVFYFPIPLTLVAYAFAVILLPTSISQNAETLSFSQVGLTGRAVRTIALVLLVVPCLHFGVVQSLKNGKVPGPFTFHGRLVRFFPCETIGAESWLKVWAKSHPDLSLSLSIRFANSRMDSAPFWNIAVRLLLDRNDFSGAARAAENSLHDSTKGERAKLLKEFQELGLVKG